MVELIRTDTNISSKGRRKDYREFLVNARFQNNTQKKCGDNYLGISNGIMRLMLRFCQYINVNRTFSAFYNKQNITKKTRNNRNIN